MTVALIGLTAGLVAALAYDVFADRPLHVTALDLISRLRHHKDGAK